MPGIGEPGFDLLKTEKKGSSCTVVLSVSPGTDPEEVAVLVSQYVTTILSSGMGGVLISHSHREIKERAWPSRVIATGTLALTGTTKTTGKTSIVFSTPQGEHLASLELSLLRLPPRIGAPRG